MDPTTIGLGAAGSVAILAVVFTFLVKMKPKNGAATKGDLSDLRGEVRELRTEVTTQGQGIARIEGLLQERRPCQLPSAEAKPPYR